MPNTTIAEQITRLQGLRNSIRTKLYNMGLVLSTADLEDCKDAIEGITDRGTPSVTLDTSTTSTSLSAGYYHGGSVGLVVKDLTGNDKITSNGTYNPPSGKVHGQVVVEVAAPSGYANVSNTDAARSEVLSNRIYVLANGTETTGTMPNIGTISYDINPLDGRNTTGYTIPEGYHDGTGYVSIHSDLLDALEAI